jgi:hypothetical protein
MTNNVLVGIKKSNFNASTAIPTTATLDYVSNGQNIKITYGDFLSGLGVTGTIAQGGDPTGSPVLDIQGSVNVIRNIVGGLGITASIDPQNSVLIDSNFSFDETGETLVDDPTAETLAYRSLVAGEDITLAASTGVIEINANTDGLKPTNRVIINQASDLPDLVSGSIPLAPGTEYFIGDNITVTSPFSLSGNVVFNGRANISGITYNGSGSLFTGTDSGNLAITDTGFNIPNASLFNIVNTTPSSIINISNLNITACDSFGSYSGIVGITIDLVAVSSANNGLVDAGTGTSVLSVSKIGIVSASASFKSIDLGSNVYNSLEIMNMQVIAPAGAFGISGLASSGNVVAGQTANVQSCEFIGDVTPLENITSDDTRYNFRANGGIEDTQPDAMLSLNSNATETVISTVNTPVLVAGTWTIEEVSQFTGTAGGRITYVGEKTLASPITVSLALVPVSGTNKDLTAYIYANNISLARKSD